jgi:Zn-dependent alcohol dehydrogenase
MKAPVLHKVREPLVVEEVELDEPQAGEVLVKMAASGVCHSCLHAADGSWSPPRTPMVLGDEGAGVVEQVGPGVSRLKPGDHVILSWTPTCGRCHYCVIGRPNLCERRQAGRGVLPDGTTRKLDGRISNETGQFAFRLLPAAARYRVTAKFGSLPAVSKEIDIEGPAVYRIALSLGEPAP